MLTDRISEISKTFFHDALGPIVRLLMSVMVLYVFMFMFMFIYNTHFSRVIKWRGYVQSITTVS